VADCTFEVSVQVHGFCVILLSLGKETPTDGLCRAECDLWAFGAEIRSGRGVGKQSGYHSP
jgi:hypothetical protein